MYDYNLSDLGQRFDVIFIDPPLEEYQRRVSGINFPQKPWGFEEVSFKNCYSVNVLRSNADSSICWQGTIWAADCFNRMLDCSFL